MKLQVAIVILGFAALSSASGYNGQLRKTLQPIPVPRNYQHQQLPVAEPALLALAGAGAPGSSHGAGAPGSSQGAGAPGSSHGAGAPGAFAAEEEVELPVVRQPVQVAYKAPTRVVERLPIRVVPATSSYSHDAEEEPLPPPRRGGYGGAGAGKKQHGREEELSLQEDEFMLSAKNAKYSFASAVDDGIQDQSHIRQETRDGLKVTGTYAYSDGYFKRTVNYEADENGYRVVSENVEPLGEEGPQIDLVNGKAEVHTQIGGVDTQYSVSADELAVNSRKTTSLLQE